MRWSKDGVSYILDQIITHYDRPVPSWVTGMYVANRNGEEHCDHLDEGLNPFVCYCLSGAITYSDGMLDDQEMLFAILDHVVESKTNGRFRYTVSFNDSLAEPGLVGTAPPELMDVLHYAKENLTELLTEVSIEPYDFLQKYQSNHMEH